MTYEVDDNLNDGTEDDISGDQDFSEFTPKVGVTYEISRNVNAYASYSEGFVVPTTSQLFTSSNSNDDLDPEKADNYEVGLRGSFWDRRIDLDVAAYTMKIEDKILSKDWNSKYYNVGETSMKGVETVLVFRPVEMLSITCAYTYAKNEFEEYVVSKRVGRDSVDVDYSGNTQPRSPKHHINARITLMPFAGFQAELEVDDVSKQYAEESNEESYNRPTLMNLRTNYDWKNWSFWAHVTNLTDKEFATYVSGEVGDISYYSGRPRTFFAGLSYRWGS